MSLSHLTSERIMLQGEEEELFFLVSPSIREEEGQSCGVQGGYGESTFFFPA